MIPLWMIIAGGVAAFVAGTGTGYWIGDNVQEIQTVKAEKASVALQLEFQKIATAAAEERAKAKQVEIARLEQLSATSALLAATSARAEAEARKREQKAVQDAQDAETELAAERAADEAAGKICPPGCRGLGAGVTRRMQAIRIGEPAAGPVPAPDRKAGSSPDPAIVPDRR